MDQELTLRYLTLFDAYETRGLPLVATIKSRISELTARETLGRRAIGRTPRLRADAALCLLTLFDLMIIRPYWGSIVTTTNRGGRPLDTFSVPQDSLGQALLFILEAMSETHEDDLYSSHDVLQGIDRAWPTLAALFGWA